MSIPTTFRRYYYLTKPGIIYGNCISAAAGFFLASKGHIDWRLLLAVLAGMALVIASGCVTNNYIDRSIDQKMARTRKRALVTGSISSRSALLYAGGLAIAGFGLLVWYTNMLVAAAGVIGLVVYVAAYGISKRRTPLGTVIGSISGSMPIAAGYLAVSGRLDMTALLLFLAMVCWQMPHFYAIAMYRLDDYKAAGLPVLPAVRGNRHTKLQIMAYIAGFTIVTAALTMFGHTGWVFLVGILAINATWLWKGYVGFKSNDDAVWARRMFRFSLLVMLVFSLLLAVDWWLP